MTVELGGGSDVRAMITSPQQLGLTRRSWGRRDADGPRGRMRQLPWRSSGAVADGLLVARAVELADLDGQAADGLGEGSGKRTLQQLEDGSGQLGFHLLAPAAEDREVHRDEGPARVSVSDPEDLVPDGSALDVVQGELARGHEDVVELLEEGWEVGCLGKVGGVFEDAGRHGAIIISAATDNGSPASFKA
jgi:hypothetical protein